MVQREKLIYFVVGAASILLLQFLFGSSSSPSPHHIKKTYVVDGSNKPDTTLKKNEDIDEGASSDYRKMSINDLFDSVNSQKQMWQYGVIYQKYFTSLRDLPVSLLEIGLRNGESIDLWLRMFEKGKIYGIDYAKGATGFKTQINKPRTHIYIGDQEDVPFLHSMIKDVKAESEREDSDEGIFDIIVDDGGHTMSQQQTSFKTLWPVLKRGGVYVMEDVETSYYKGTGWGCYGKECGGGEIGKPGTTIAMIKSLIDVLNRDFVDGPHSKPTEHKGSYSIVPKDNQLDHLACHRNICFMWKKK